ncbi:MAG: SLBB domain-containing protein [Gemmatimonadetes bacterium]|nr:SLBB domain-containing protein [Gemmatimonadota bacterium]
MSADRAAWVSVALGVWLIAASPGTAQEQRRDSLAARPLASREALQTLARFLEPSDGAGDSNRLLLERVRARLEAGDFRPGDQIRLSVQAESTLSDTFTVGPDLSVQLPPPTVGTLPLKGVLRSELEPHVTSYIARFLRDPVVRAWPLLRVSVQGEVVHAGFYGVPAAAVLSDALMAAGGTTPMADMQKLRIVRDGQSIWEGPALRQAIAQGLTLDAASLRDGDQILVPRRRDSGFQDNLRFMWLVLSVTTGVIAITRLLP